MRIGRLAAVRRTGLLGRVALAGVGCLAAATIAACHHDSSISVGPPATHGRTVVTLTPSTIDGRGVTDDQLTAVQSVLRQRFAAARIAVAGMRIVVPSQIEVTLNAALTTTQVDAYVAPARLEFRAVDGASSSAPTAPSAPATAPSPTTTPAISAELAAVTKKLGPAYPLAASLTDPQAAAADPATVAALAPFSRLTAEEVAALPAKIQFNVPTVTCAQLDARNPDWITDDRSLGQRVVACDATQPGVKYLLDAAKVGGADIASASAVYDTTNYSANGGTGWAVNLTFTGSGQPKWSTLTAAEVDNQVAIVLDNLVISAPTIDQVINGPAVISGGIDEHSAKTLAAQVTSGSLPVTLTISSVVTAS